MVESDGWKPGDKEAAFNAGEHGGGGVPQDPGVPHEGQNQLTGEEVRRELRARIGINMIANINEVIVRDYDDVVGEFATLSNDDLLKIEYYKFNIAVSLIGVNPLELPGRSEEQKEADRSVFDSGASLVAGEYLRDDPDNPVAKKIWNEGAGAPVEAHRAFFKVVNSNVRHFLQKYRPPPS